MLLLNTTEQDSANPQSGENYHSHISHDKGEIVNITTLQQQVVDTITTTTTIVNQLLHNNNVVISNDCAIFWSLMFLFKRERRCICC